MRKSDRKTEAQFAQFFDPVLRALKNLGGSGRPAEVKAWLLANVKLDPSYLTELNRSGETKFSNQVDWARFYLVRAGYLDSSKRGVWSLTELGRANEIDARRATEIIRDVASAIKSTGAKTAAEHDPRDFVVPEAYESAATDYRSRVLDLILALPPKGFEQLGQRLLREAGFEKVEVTGKTGDGGIDGHGILQINPFVSFQVLFQCKRYAGSVGPEKIRDFRGAMAGRSDKGIVITTGSFTAAAAVEAARDGVPSIELVDADGLIKLLEQLELGLRPKQTYEVDESFFREFASPENATMMK